MAGSPSCPLKIEVRENKKKQMKIVPSPALIEATPAIKNRWTGNSASYFFGNQAPQETSLMEEVIEKSSNNYQMIEKLNTIEYNIQTILKYLTELSKQFNDMNTEINNQAIEILNSNHILNDIVCPLLEDITNIIYTQIK